MFSQYKLVYIYCTFISDSFTLTNNMNVRQTRYALTVSIAYLTIYFFNYFRLLGPNTTKFTRSFYTMSA